MVDVAATGKPLFSSEILTLAVKGDIVIRISKHLLIHLFPRLVCSGVWHAAN